MPLTNQEIVTDADSLVPNAFTTADKIPWLSAVNAEFFDVVKIPITAPFTTVSGTKTYTLTGTIKEKNIDKVMAGHLKFRSLNYEDVQPGQNYFTFDEVSKVLTLSAAPSRAGLSGIARHRKSAVTTFTAASVATQTPDAPDEYHWIYVLGLAEYIAKASGREPDSTNYGGQYRNALQVAAQNFQKEGAT